MILPLIYNKFTLHIRIYIQSFLLPFFLHLTHLAILATAETSVTDVDPSASQTGVVEVISQPSAYPDMSPQTLQAPVERHL